MMPNENEFSLCVIFQRYFEKQFVDSNEIFINKTFTLIVKKLPCHSPFFITHLTKYHCFVFFAILVNYNSIIPHNFYGFLISQIFLQTNNLKTFLHFFPYHESLS